jgi:hypothetical protein
MTFSNFSIEVSDLRNPYPSDSAATHVEMFWRSELPEVAHSRLAH